MNKEPSISMSIADDQDRERIYAIRYQVYSQELGQHCANEAGRIKDALDSVNVYLAAKVKDEIAGFVSITPPTDTGFSIDKYFARDDLPLRFDQGLYEVRLLTVDPARRASRIVAALMYGAWRYVASRGGLEIVCLGRQEIVEMYERVGFKRLGMRARSGKVTYELMTRSVRDESDRTRQIADRIEKHVAWNLRSVGFRPSDACYHGGAFFEAIGDEFERLPTRHEVINADVLDAWFDPSPAVVDAIAKHLPWTLKTSPPTGCEGMRRVLARARGVHETNLLPGAGSSDLIFLALRHWLRRDSRVLILDPMYGEYAHVLEKVVGCQVDRLRLPRARNYAVDCDELASSLKRAYDLVVLVNPNSPTGQHIRSEELQRVISSAPSGTRFWIDETYVDFVNPSQSLERFASASDNVVICKSMSKAYALSGARCAYLCGPAALLDELRIISPPWAVSLPGQIAACAALRSISYYRARWDATRVLREELSAALCQLGWDIVPGSANFLLCHLPPEHPEASALASACSKRKLFVRDVSNMGKCFDARVLRVAVKDATTNEAMVNILRLTLAEMPRIERKAAA
jgi:histidinol-phosphate/aromatic aminotransferase/cobyric acid decarboxylase-like protein/ribosomal protein S18 acetylase RimI-like enzyme